MRKHFTLLLKSVAAAALLSFPAVSSAQKSTVIFFEDFGTAASEKDELITDHVWGKNPADMFSWNVEGENSINVRTNNPSEGYEGASADGNLYFKGQASFTILGLNTSGYEQTALTFGAFGKNKDDVTHMTVTASDGISTRKLADFADLGLDNGKKAWSKGTVTGLPAATSLSLTFTSDLDLADDGGIRLDDITITGLSPVAGIQHVATKGIISQTGRTLTYSAATGKAEIFSTEGRKCGELKANSSITLNVPAGVYLVKANEAVMKIFIR